MTVYVDNTNVLKLSELVDSDGVAVAGATVVVSLADVAGIAVTGQAWPQTMQEMSAGNYELSLPAVLGFAANVEYIATIDVSFAGEVGHWEHRFIAHERKTS